MNGNVCRTRGKILAEAKGLSATSFRRQTEEKMVDFCFNYMLYIFQK